MKGRYMSGNCSVFCKIGKDSIDKIKHSNVVYKISCNQCDATYVGQTKRQLQTRIKEHKSDINRSMGSPSVISQHRLTHNHDFKWNNVEILDIEQAYIKRLISEMIHIKKTNEQPQINKTIQNNSQTYIYLS